jgi:putative ABC transport system permease protein
VTLLLRKLWRDTLRQRAPFAAVVLTTLLGVAMYAASYDAYADLQASYAALFDRTHFADLTVTGGDVQTFARAAASTRGVAAVETRTIADVPLMIGGAHNLLGRVIGLPAGQPPAVDDVIVMKGSYLDPSQPDGVLVERHLADYYHLQPGSQLGVLTTGGWNDLTVRGVVASAEYLWPARSRQELFTTPDQFGVVLASEAFAQSIEGAQQQALVLFEPAADSTALTAQLGGMADSAGAIDSLDKADQPSNAALREDINGFGELAVMFPVLFLGAAGVTIYVVLGRLVQGQRAQIGMLRANGIGMGVPLIHYASFGLATCLVGGILGGVLGGVLAGAITTEYTGELGIPLTVIRLHPDTALIGLFLAVIAGILASASPALAASRVEPAVALRGLGPTTSGGRSLLERVVPPLRRSSAGGKLVVRAISRQPRRALSVCIAVVLALTLMLVSWGMLDTTQVLLARQFGQIQREDATVYAERSVDAGLLAEIRSTPGVAIAEPVAQLPVSAQNAGKRYATRLVALPRDTNLHEFLDSSGVRMQLPERGVLVGSALREKLGVRVGDDVSLTLPGNSQPLALPITGFVGEPMGTYVYVSLTALQEAAPGVAAKAALVGFDPGQDRATVRSRLSAVSGVAVVEDAHVIADAANQYMGLFYLFVGVMLIFGAVLAFALLFTTITVNMADRTVELATLRAAGVRQGQLARLVTVENLLTVGLSLLPGLLIGTLAARAFMATFSSDLFRFDLQVEPRTYVFAGLVIVLTAITSQFPALSAIGRLNLAETVRERSQ